MFGEQKQIENTNYEVSLMECVSIIDDPILGQLFVNEEGAISLEWEDAYMKYLWERSI